MQCPNCEAENSEDARFCDECGFPLRGAIARTSYAASPSPDVAHQAASPYAKLASRRTGAATSYPPPHPASPYTAESAQGVYPVRQTYRGGYDESALEDDFDAFEHEVAVDAVAPSPDRTAPLDDFQSPHSDSDQAYDAYDAYNSYGSYPDDDQEADMAEGDQPYGERGADPLDFAVPFESLPNDYAGEMRRIDQDQSFRSRDFHVDDKMPRRSSGKRALIIVIGAIVGIAIAVLATFALGLWGGNVVPDVTGLAETDAIRVLNDTGFSVRTVQEMSDDTEGIVLFSDPEPNSRAAERSEIIIYVSTPCFVPDIVGKSREEAEALLADSGYRNVRYESVKSDKEENVVQSVSPDSGTRAKAGAEVVVKVSEAYRVPSISGLDLSAAEDAISDAGLTPEIVYIDTDQYPDGSIIGTDPEAGTKVSKGEYVAISVARIRGVELMGLTENLLSQGNTVSIDGIDYEMESVISVSYQGDNTVAFTATGRPKITFFGETLYASSSQTVSGQVFWSEDDEVISIL